MKVKDWIPWRRGNEETNDRGALVPRGGMNAFRSEIDRMFDRFFEDPWSAFSFPWAHGRGWAPTVDVSESGEEIRVRAEIPGVQPEDVRVAIEDGLLILEGEKTESSERDEEVGHLRERRFGTFRRTIELPATVDPESAVARHENGVLTVRFQRRPGAEPRRIHVDVRRD